MKQILIIALALTLPFLAGAKNYKYNKLCIASTGSDNIAFDRVQTRDVIGNISLTAGHMRIDGKDFKLKPSKMDGVYKAKGYLFRFYYEKGELAYIQQFRYDKVYRYYIQNETANTAASMAVK